MFYRELQGVRAAELVHVQSIESVHGIGDGLPRVEDHPVEHPIRACKPQACVAATDDALVDDPEPIQEAGFGEALAPHAVRERTRALKRRFLDRQWTVAFQLPLQIRR